jgi:hypothetical protein
MATSPSISDGKIRRRADVGLVTKPHYPERFSLPADLMGGQAV